LAEEAASEQGVSVAPCHLLLALALEREATLIGILSTFNAAYSGKMYESGTHYGLGNAIYFTFTTMSTLGACGFNSTTQTGKILEMIDVGAGLFFFSSILSATFKRILP
jgi:hypothetical protein